MQVEFNLSLDRIRDLVSIDCPLVSRAVFASTVVANEYLQLIALPIVVPEQDNEDVLVSVKLPWVTLLYLNVLI